MGDISCKDRRGSVPRILAAAGLVLGLLGCAALERPSPQELEKAYGTHPPRWEANFAARAIRAGDVWRVYVKGSDPDGDIALVNAWFEVPSRPTTPVLFTVEPDQGNLVSGYLTLRTIDLEPMLSNLFGRPFRLMVTLEDRAHHRSDTLFLALTFDNVAGQPEPPKGVFQERFLGDIPAPYAAVEVGPGLGGFDR